VIESGVEADLVEEENAGRARGAVQRSHFGRNVGCRDQRHAARDRGLGHLDVLHVRKEAHDEVGIGDERGYPCVVVR
jgi:hypothetical protein